MNASLNNIDENKQMYDVFVSYSTTDSEIVMPIINALEERGISVWYAPKCITGVYVQSIVNAISSSAVFMPMITENSVNSAHWLNELDFAYEKAKDRSKIIFPVMLSDINKNETNAAFYYLSRYVYFDARGDEKNWKHKLVEQIWNLTYERKSDSILFEKLTEYMSIGANYNATEMLCELIARLNEKIQNAEYSQKERLYLTLYSYLEKMAELYDYEYGEDARMLARKKLEIIDKVSLLLNDEIFCSDDLYYTAMAIRLIYLDREIRLDCADAITGGDVSEGLVETLPEKDYAIKQEEYVSRLRNLMAHNIGSISDAQMKFVNATETYIYSRREKKSVLRQKNSITSDDELLLSVATFMREGNKLFDIISERQGAKDFLQCLITSYERLKGYSDVVGAKDICAECIDRIAELKEKMIKVTENEKVTEKAETGIKTLLGLTVPKSGKYDVFISHKREDYDIALEMFDFLRSNLKETFFDKYSLPEMSEAKYRKSIMQALDGAKHFVVVFSDLDYLESDWIKLEMEVFQAEKDEGRKTGNFLMVVTNDVYGKIMSSNKTVLPIEYRRCEIIKLDDYKSVLLNYLNT